MVQAYLRGGAAPEAEGEAGGEAEVEAEVEAEGEAGGGRRCRYVNDPV
jgi:hypothetical protein